MAKKFGKGPDSFTREDGGRATKIPPGGGLTDPPPGRILISDHRRSKSKMTYLLAEVSALVHGQKLASRPAPQRTWRDRANAGAIDLQASAACDLASTLADENLCDRLQAARILQGWLQGVA